MEAFRTWLIAGSLAILVLGGYVRFTDLGQFTTADEARWHANVANFTAAMATGAWAETYQLPHPGITLQWFAAPAAEANSWTKRKTPLIVAQTILLLLSGYIWYRLWGKSGLTMTALLAINPLLVAHTRVYAMDSLLAILLLLSIGCLLLWNMTNATRYLVFGAIKVALAVLSKLPGMLIMPFTIATIVYWQRKNPRVLMRSIIIWLLAFVISLPIIFPALAVRPVTMIQNMMEFFSSDDYTELHPANKLYYLRTLIFFSTPLQMVVIAALPFVWKKLSAHHKQHVIILLLFAAAFTLTMSLGSKMGDRYILPVFLILDAVAALLMAKLLPSLTDKTHSYGFRLAASGLVALFIWQAADLYRLHPYHLAYVNPITKPFFGERRLGWGEGLDIAAAYLNQKPDANNLNVAAYYSTQFADYFNGKTVPLHEWDTGHAHYAVLYRAQLERGEEAWETDIWQQFQSRHPEHLIELNGLPYIWIYALKNE